MSIQSTDVYSVPNASLSLIQSYTFDYDVKSCILFVTTYISGTYPVIQYTPLAFVPQYSQWNTVPTFVHPSVTNCRGMVYFHDNTLDFYYANVSSAPTQISINSTVALVIKK